MNIFKKRTKLSTIILASLLSLSACSDDDSNSVAPSTSEEHEHHATDEHSGSGETHSGAADEHSGYATESGDHKSASSGLTLGEENIKDGIIFLQDTTIDGVLTVNASTPGATVLKNVKVTGNLLIKRSGRVDFSGSADVVHVGSSNTDVYAFEDEAQVNGHHFMGKNNTFTSGTFFLHSCRLSIWRAVDVVLVSLLWTCNRAPLDKFFERFVGLVIGDLAICSDIFHDSCTTLVHALHRRSQMGAHLARLHATNACITAKWYGRNAKFRFATLYSNARSWKSEHELSDPHAERARSNEMPSLVYEHEKAKHNGGCEYHDENIHGFYYIGL